MNLNSVSNLYKDTIDNYSEVVFNTNGGVGLPASMETIDKLTKAQEDHIGGLWNPAKSYSSGDLVSSDNTTLYISLINGNTSTLDNESSWKVVRENYFADGEINIVASAYISYRSVDEMDGGNGVGILSHNIEAEGITRVRYINRGTVDGNGNPVKDKEISTMDLRVILKAGANIEDDKYTVLVSCPKLKASSGGMAYSAYTRVFDKTKTGFTISASRDRIGSEEWLPGWSSAYAIISVVIIK